MKPMGVVMKPGAHDHMLWYALHSALWYKAATLVEREVQASIRIDSSESAAEIEENESVEL